MATDLNRIVFVGLNSHTLLPWIAIPGKLSGSGEQGREPRTEFDKRFISHALTDLRNHTVPWVMRAVGGRMLDSPLHSELYGVVGGHDTVDGFLRALNGKLTCLRETGGASS